MANFWKNKFNKTNKSAYDISKEINVPEEKVKEIIKGERQVPTKDIDRVNEAFTNKKTEKITSFERAMMEQYFADNDYMDLKKKFGYKSLAELSKAIGIGLSTIYYLRGQKIKAISDNLLKKIYDFFQNDWNKQTKPKYKRKATKIWYYQMPIDQLANEVIDWYNRANLKQLRKSKNLKVDEFMKILGFTSAYSSAYYKFENKSERKATSNWLIVQQLYNFYHNLELINAIATCKEELYGHDATPSIEAADDIKTREEKYKYNAELSEPTDDRYEALLKEYQVAIKELNRYKYLIDKIMEKE